MNKEIIIPNCISTTGDYKNVKEIKNIIFIGRKDIRTKGLDLLFDAVEMVAKDLKEQKIKIIIYGIGNIDEESYINSRIAKGLQEICFNECSVFDDEKKKAYLSADALILTSRNEGLPMAVLEAISFGLPVLITKSTNVETLVKNKKMWFCV